MGSDKVESRTRGCHMNLRDVLNNEPDIRCHLFEKGYLITDASLSVSPDEYPFYGNWTLKTLGEYSFWIYKTVRLYSVHNKGREFFLIGHAYNPFSMETEEERLLSEIASKYGTSEYWDKINELTGVFIMGTVAGRSIEFVLDASGMQYGCYGEIDGKQYISSHMQLIGDLCGLEQTDYVKRLVRYRWYRYMLGNYMPGDITCFGELKRVIPNTYVIFDGSYHVERFYPARQLNMCKSRKEYMEVIHQAAEIMQNTMKLIPLKWERPAISLTGGIDSNTTFAAASSCYDRYTTFSYISMDRELVDAEKAKEISEHFGVPHTDYYVPDSNDAFPKYEIYKAVIEHNGGNIGTTKDADNRKKITLMQSDVCDVEIKSWISETIRAYAYKYYGRKRFPKRLRARDFTSLYKIFLLDRRLAVRTDEYFREYLENTKLEECLFNYDETDFFVWEMEHGGKCGLDIGVMKSCFDITIPYNNRKLLDLLLRVPLKYRISDRHHLDLKKVMNKDLYDLNIRVVNLNETEMRKRMINLYYMINTKLPF